MNHIAHLNPLRAAVKATSNSHKRILVIKPYRFAVAPSQLRGYATHQDKPSGSSSSSTTYDSLESSARRKVREEAFDGRESVGPFPLGVGPSGRRKAWRRWGELGIGGKLMRTTQQTGNLAIILVGGTLFVVLALSLTTELFAPNSPGVLYSKAVDMIRASDALNSHLLPPLTFTHTPYPASPVRGSPPLPHRIVRHPRSNRDHLLITFWVHGRGKDEPETLHWAKRGWKNVESWTQTAGAYIGLGHGGSSYQDTSSSAATPTVVSREDDNQGEGSSGGNMLGRLFGGLTSLRTTTSSPKESSRGLPPPGTYKAGEVHADYVKYQLLSLVIDVPSSAAAYPSRAVVFWSPEADTEGLVGKKR